ncbi:MAG: hypothetical protein DWH82_11195 [Planctomycetota bacterium]|nr:MAG: hypothetical protein DWH82_11195 [Planctomycetota bacterium]
MLDALDLLGQSVHLLDGPVGTAIGELLPGLAASPHLASLQEPDVVVALHRSYLQAGARALQANAWLALHLASTEARAVIGAAADCLRLACLEAADPPALVLSLAPGPGSPPAGPPSWLNALKSFDAVVVETLVNPWQLAWVAWLAEWSPVPVAASMVPDSRPGAWDAADFAQRARRAGAQAAGVNCGYPDSPYAASEAIRLMRQAAPRLPLLARPARWDMVSWLHESVACAEAGANWVGGCCGTTHEDLAGLAARLRQPSGR